MGNCRLGGKHWQRLWDNPAIRNELIHEAQREEIERDRPILEGLTELYILHNYSFTPMLHFIGALKGEQTAYSEIERHKANPRLSPEEQRELDEYRVNTAFEAMNSQVKNIS